MGTLVNNIPGLRLDIKTRLVLENACLSGPTNLGFIKRSRSLVSKDALLLISVCFLLSS